MIQPIKTVIIKMKWDKTTNYNQTVEMIKPYNSYSRFNRLNRQICHRLTIWEFSDIKVSTVVGLGLHFWATWCKEYNIFELGQPKKSSQQKEKQMVEYINKEKVWCYCQIRLLVTGYGFSFPFLILLLLIASMISH